MKIFYLLSAAILLGAGSASAESKIDARGRQLLDLYNAGQLKYEDNKAFIAVPATRGSEPMVNVLVETNDSAVLDSLASLGYATEYISQDFSIVTMPVSGIDPLALSPAVETLSFGQEYYPLMDQARGASNVNTVHLGVGISYQGQSRHPFKGDGVIVGMFDTGFDPSHINFMTDDGSACRIKYYERFSGGTSGGRYTGDNVRTAPTDDTGETHGTHVAGIMGGAYNGPGKYYVVNSDKTVTDAGKVALYGVAPNADLAICAGPLYNSSILSGIRHLIDFAKDERKPIVINLSLGGNDGPHDGTDSFSRSLDQLAQEAIICVAAGNEGADNIHAGKTFTDTDKSVKVLLANNQLQGLVDVWSSTSDEITVSLIVVKSNTGEITAKISSKDGTTVTCGSNNDDHNHSIFRNAFDGSPVLTAKRVGNRYEVAISSNQKVTPKSGTSEVLGIMIEGNAGVRVDAYGSRLVGFSTAAPAGFDRPDNNGSINSLGCGHNTIIVGAYNTRSTWYDINGSSHSYGGNPAGNIADYSSWGELIDGRKLPHICAPGTGINSSYNGYYVTPNYNNVKSMVVASAQEGTTTHYWGVMQGTSMATPYVTGTIGLWLQANPDLSTSEARDIIISTAKKDDRVTDDVKWGAGKLHAVNGLKKVISQMSSVSDVTTESSDILLSLSGRTFEAFAGGAASVELSLYDAAGSLVAHKLATGETATVEVPAAGFYIVSAKAGASTTTKKVMVK